ncbi:fasciclin-2-like isoform X2 [Pollicipes pollicipes]|uniref:fasciclin-2-like isoform X2 n=1 Tax=Pollicipes pollicipes TaxID=41117 RepID=UPI001885975B|nr:fasciclin-2-like isoform X2 [Pollicipes pollicipes]
MALGACWPPLLLLLGAGLGGDHVVAGQLQLSPSRREHVVFDGKALFVSCKGRDPVGMVWLDPGNKDIVERRGAVRVEPSRDRGDGRTGVDLVLNPVKRKDRGRYTCRATVGGAEQETSFNLVVLKPIQFDEDQLTQFAAEGSDFTVRCDVTGDPRPEVDWRGVSQHLNFGEDKKFDIDPETRGLIIRGVTRADEGIYRCKATQVNTKDSDLRTADIRLKVQYKPEWSGPTQSEVYGYLLGRANLTCQAEA